MSSFTSLLVVSPKEKPRSGALKTTRTRKPSDNRRKPLHCPDCGADLSRGVSQVLHGGTRRAAHLCIKCAEIRQGIRNKYGRRIADE